MQLAFLYHFFFAFPLCFLLFFSSSLFFFAFLLCFSSLLSSLLFFFAFLLCFSSSLFFFAFLLCFSSLHAHIHRHTCLDPVTLARTHDPMLLSIQVFVPPFPWLNFPFLCCVPFSFRKKKKKSITSPMPALCYYSLASYMFRNLFSGCAFRLKVGRKSMNQ